MNRRLLIIIGPTATGKTSLGLKLAKEFNGEIISADSRQVYRFMDIGTGKDLAANFKFQISNFKLEETRPELTYGYYLSGSVPVWGLDIVEPDYHFNVADWVEYATKVISDIQSREKLPIIVGGTGLYIRSLIRPPETLTVPVDQKLRDQLGKLTLEELQTKLIEIDGNRWGLMNQSDRQNPRRLVRAIEVAGQSQKSKVKSQNYQSKVKKTEILTIGLTADRELINKRIDRRVDERIRLGMAGEARNLLKKGYSRDLPSLSGTGYKQFKFKYKFKTELENQEINQIMVEWKTAEHQYAGRQMTYFQKYFPQTEWFDIQRPGFEAEIRNLVRNFVE